jgi:AcrR family transcriptional regulator
MTQAATRLPAEQRRRQLLDVACDVFAERGFSATSMDDVAVAAGVTKPVLYQHFRSKRALYTELLHSTGDQLLIALRCATDSATTGRARVEAGFDAYFRYVTAHPNAFRLLFGASVRNNPTFGEIHDRFVEQVAATITDLIEIDAPTAQRTALAHALVGMAESTSRRALADFESDGDEFDAKQLARWLSELSWFGLRGVRA